MISPDFDPLAILDDLQVQLHHLAVNQQGIAQNLQHLHQYVTKLQAQIDGLTNLAALTNQKIDIVKGEIELRLDKIKP